MMLNTYKATAKALCPVDPSVVDVYEVTIVSTALLRVEFLLETIAKYERKEIFQEYLTSALLRDFDAVSVVTVGEHSGVETTCRYQP